MARRIRLIPWMLAGALACQGVSPSDQPAERTAPPPVPAGTSLPGHAPAGPSTQPGAAGLAGLVTAASDVSGLPDEPLADQLVLALPVDRAAQILGADRSQLTGETLRFLKANLSQADPALAVARSDSAGRYTLRLAPGAYVLCLADSDVMPPGFPATTRGCGLAEVTPGALRQVDISSGFGEILLITP